MFGSVVFSIGRTSYERFFVPQLISVKGISEGEWESKRPIWQGDCDRWENSRPKKRARTSSDGTDEIIQDGDRDGDSMVQSVNKE